jgi:hypothetical protein
VLAVLLQVGLPKPQVFPTHDIAVEEIGFVASLDSSARLLLPKTARGVVLPIQPKLACAPRLLLETLCYLQLRPHEVSVLAHLLHLLPPETTPEDSLNDGRVVAKTNIVF